jgi:hypothetical protein
MKTNPRISSAIAFATVLLLSAAASAQIDHPGGHPHYAAEIEPRLVVQWDDEPWWDDDGIGLGIRASIPVVQDGPVRTINNSLALSFGLDWAHFDDACWGPGPRPNVISDDCSANDFWLPFVVQWNFFFSDLISAFPELGLGLEYETWDGDLCGSGRNLYVCGDGDSSDVDIELLLWLGVRFHVADSFAITLRLGTPSLTLGASFFL